MYPQHDCCCFFLIILFLSGVDPEGLKQKLKPIKL